MDSVTDSLSVARLISEALKQSPTTGNGFGFGLAVMVAVCAFFAAFTFLVWKAFRGDNRKYLQASIDARNEIKDQVNANIEKRFDRLEQQTREAFNELASEAKEDGKRIEKLNERVVRLEVLQGLRRDGD